MCRTSKSDAVGPLDGNPAGSLRKRAASFIRAKSVVRANRQNKDLIAAIQELRVHQLELEIQNEELRRAQVELARSRDLYTDLYEFAPVGYLTLDEKGIIRKSNLTAAMIFGVDCDKLIDTHLSRFVDPGSQDALFSHLRRLSPDSGFDTVELKVKPVSPGPDMFIKLQSMWQAEKADAKAEIRTALLDITARIQAEHELRVLKGELEQRMEERTTELRVSVAATRSTQAELEGIINTAMDAIVGVNPDQRIVLFNRSAESMFGWSASEILGRELDCLVPHRLRSRSRALVYKVLNYETAKRWDGQRLSLVALRSDGTEFPVEAAISSTETRERKIGIAILRDVTERLRASEQLRKSGQALTDFFNESPLGLMWIGPDGRVIQANAAKLELLGRPDKDVIGAPLTELHDHAEIITGMLEELAHGTTVRNQRAQITRPDGTSRQVLIDANGLWQDGRLVHTRWVVRDISDRVALERRILSIAEQERERFGRDLHDDLCQHLTAIEFMNETAIARWAGKNPKALKAGREVSLALRQATEHARELARGLAIPMLAYPDGLTIALQELAVTTRHAYRHECEFKGTTPLIIQDCEARVHLYRIAQEAVSNAVKHAKASRIDIRLTAMDSDVILAIQDDGNGLVAKLQRKKGMGLRIMQYRAGAIGGTLVVQHETNGGTAVICTVKGALTQVPSAKA